MSPSMRARADLCAEAMAIVFYRVRGKRSDPDFSLSTEKIESTNFGVRFGPP